MKPELTVVQMIPKETFKLRIKSTDNKFLNTIIRYLD